MMEMEMNADMDKDGGSEDGKSKSITGSSAGSIFCTLERDYAKLLLDMKENEALALYKAEYTRLFEAIYKCRQEEEQLLTKFRQLQEEVIEKTNKICDFEEKIKYHEETIKKLNEDIISTSKLADAAHTREQNSQEVIEYLKLTISKLNHEIEQRNKKISIEENDSSLKQNENSLKEKERLSTEIETLKLRIENMSVYIENLEEKVNEYDEKIVKMQEEMDIKINEISKERVIRDRVESHLEQLKQEIETKNERLQAGDAAIKTSVNDTNKLKTSLRKQKNLNEKLQKEINKLTVDEINLKTELKLAGEQINQFKEVFSKKNNDCETLTIENKRLKTMIFKYEADNKFTKNKCAKIDNARINAEKNLRDVESSLKNIETEMELCRRQITIEKQTGESALRDKNKLSKMVDALKDAIKRAQYLVDISENSKSNVESELEKTVKLNNATNKRLQSVENEKEKCLTQINTLTQQIEKYTNQLKHKDKEISNRNKELSSLENALKQQQSVVESLRSERNASFKNLAGSNNEIKDLRDKLRLISGQIEQVKEDAALKQEAIVRIEYKMKSSEEEKESTKNELKKLEEKMSDLREANVKLNETVKQLRDNIKAAEIDKTQIKKEIDYIMSDRDVLGTQLVRRNDELRLQYSKIKILHGILCRGESEYTKRIDDIKLLKLEVNKLTMEKALLIKRLKNMSNLRSETYHLDRDLTQERLKVMALEEELQNPLNIHRWRKLSGSDPTMNELLKKNQLLQKRLLKLNQKLIMKSNKIHEMEKFYMNLRQILLQQPGPEVLHDLTKTKIAIKERDKEIKCLIAELNMREFQASQNSNIVEKISQDLREMQTKYYTLKHKGQNIPSRESASAHPPASSSNHKKYCGGGFTMLVAPSQNCWTSTLNL